MKVQAAVKAFLFFVPAISAFVFPDDKCLYAANVEDCFGKAIQSALAKLGSEEGVTSPINMTIEPLLYNKMVFNLNEPIMKAAYNFTDSIISGWSKSIVENVSVNADELILKFSLRTSVFKMAGNYSMEGEMVLSNSTTFSSIDGNGPATHVLNGVISNHTVKTTTVTIDGEEYLAVESYTVSLSVDHISVELTNLYNGQDPEAAALAQAVIDANTMGFFQETQYILNGYFADLFKSYLEKLITSVPKKDIFAN
ncbi:hypothetical protein JTB14_016921 [Gonioctena quinquepunctata]|nr:hypothetical protein JTB14_016921 [Gonioctena quinquepunctata]